MLFAFYAGRNRRGNDLICKTLEHIGEYRPGAGASLQLNATENLVCHGENVVITHHGFVTRGHRIGRDVLAELILSSAPIAAREMGVVFTPTSWPLPLGASNALAAFIDRLYLYAVCIQAAKDAFDALKRYSPENVRKGSGQGHMADPEIRGAVEDYAMRIVEAHYRSNGYEVQDVHKSPGMLDFKCTKGRSQILVEVKGTLSMGDAVELTAAEILLASKQTTQVDLAVLSDILVDRHQTPLRASGGRLRVFHNFNPKHHMMVATKHRCTLDKKRSSEV